MIGSHQWILALAAIAMALVCAACHGHGARARSEEKAARADTPAVSEATAVSRVGESIVIAGQRYPIGAPVVLWTDPGGYSAYTTELFFSGERRADAPKG